MFDTFGVSLTGQLVSIQDKRRQRHQRPQLLRYSACSHGKRGRAVHTDGTTIRHEPDPETHTYAAGGANAQEALGDTKRVHQQQLRTLIRVALVLRQKQASAEIEHKDA